LDLLDHPDLPDPLDLLEPLQHLLLLKVEVESHRHRTQTIKVVMHQELRLQTNPYLVAMRGAQLPMLAFVSVMQLNLPLSRHVLSYQEMSMVPPFAPATLQR
jgi:hypothetical protein